MAVATLFDSACQSGELNAPAEVPGFAGTAPFCCAEAMRWRYEMQNAALKSLLMLLLCYTLLARFVHLLYLLQCLLDAHGRSSTSFRGCAVSCKLQRLRMTLTEQLLSSPCCPCCSLAQVTGVTTTCPDMGPTPLPLWPFHSCCPEPNTWSNPKRVLRHSLGFQILHQEWLI
eukprot:114286-Chlamydomonas_euryale.AAC.5